MGGDFQVNPAVLAEAEWQQVVGGEARAGSNAIGTCTVAEPANNIDFHWISKNLLNVTSLAEIDLNVDLSPHRPVWAVLRLADGQPVPVQNQLRLADQPKLGPAREPPEYAAVLVAGRETEKNIQTGNSANMQEQIDNNYEAWLGLAVNEALWLEDKNPDLVPEALKATAGGPMQMRWEDPRRKLRDGRTAVPIWAGACRWLERRLAGITKLLPNLKHK